jgi:excinuclease ABC subunit A
MGPEGGRGGGQLIAYGTPEEVVKKGVGYTAQFLKQALERYKQ